MKLGESREDYLEAAYILKQKHGYVRNSMLCEYMNYAKSSISIAVKTLTKNGYVVRDKYGCIDLTEKGEKVAKEIYARHQLLQEFLVTIGVSEETANTDACHMEHAISEETFERLQQLVKSERLKK